MHGDDEREAHAPHKRSVSGPVEAERMGSAVQDLGSLATPVPPESALEEALARADGVDPLVRACAQLCLGERLRRLGRRIEARRHLDAAVETFVQTGAQAWAERARAELAASVETMRKGDTAVQDELTPQERQVALLVARGGTNREAAAELFLSTKTIEFHLSNAFRKLGVRTRTELAYLLLGAQAA
jgi:DNA-binding CsgD family transcriptional regulator